MALQQQGHRDTKLRAKRARHTTPSPKQWQKPSLPEEDLQFKFIVPIYEFPVFFALTSDIGASIDKLPERLGREIKDRYGDDLDCAGLYSGADNAYAIIINKRDIETLDHEVGHVCQLIMHNIGFDVICGCGETPNDEPLRYLSGWMMNFILDKMEKMLKKHNKKD